MADHKYGKYDMKKVEEWFSNNNLSRNLQFINEFEEKFRKIHNAQHTIAINNAMTGLRICLLSIGIEQGDEVIVDPIVVFGGLAALTMGATPVFADVHEDTFNMRPESMEKLITKKTKAIICTHQFGNICEMEKIKEIADTQNIPIIEDCAHAILAKRNDQFAGNFGTFGVFSFNHRKHLSLGQGGMLTINDENYYDYINNKLKFGRIPQVKTWNYAMSSLVAAAGITQLNKLEEYIKQDCEFADKYNEAIKECSWLTAQKVNKENKSSWHIWSAIFTGDEEGIDYGEFMEKCRANGADYFLPSFIPDGFEGITPSPVYKYRLFASELDEMPSCPVAEYIVPRLFNTVLSPVPSQKTLRYISGLKKTIEQFEN